MHAQGATAPLPPAGGRGIVFDAVSVAYQHSVVLDDFSLRVEAGEFMALIGPSGSGKSTALRCVAGFTQARAGRIFIGNSDVTNVPPYQRGIGMVVQNYALFPHMKVEDNVAFGLQAQGAPKERIARRVHECLRLVGMSAYQGRYPRQLSGGQQQRVAIARALAIEPRVLLLDEPLSALDAQIRRAMVEELSSLHQALPELTVLYVTHDQTEALTLADRIAILRGGKLSAVGPSHALYQQPPNRFSAEFLGNANLLPVVCEPASDANAGAVQFAGTRLSTQAHALAPGSAALLCVRPHALEVVDAGCAMANVLHGTVQSEYWHGEQQTLRVECAGAVLRVSAPPHLTLPPVGARISVRFDAALATVVPDDASGSQGRADAAL